MDLLRHLQSCGSMINSWSSPHFLIDSWFIHKISRLYSWVCSCRRGSRSIHWDAEDHGDPRNDSGTEETIYGLKQASLYFFRTLKEGLEERGFHSSQFDPCLFLWDKEVVLIYVDDWIFFATEETYIDDVINSLRCNKPRAFTLSIEDDYAGFLGINIEKREDGSTHLTLIGLIDRILESLNLNCEQVTIRNNTLAATKTLGKDENGPQEKKTGTTLQSSTCWFILGVTQGWALPSLSITVRDWRIFLDWYSNKTSSSLVVTCAVQEKRVSFEDQQRIFS